ncbi:MAG TPA: DNA polymerase LigD, partial [Streptosporangiaceae bacterium]
MTDLPRLIKPMLASLRHEFPPDEESYGWELKWDGLRAVAYVENGRVRLVSRNDKDMAASYPELGVLAERTRAPVILDGEIVALRHGRPDFGLLQSRMHVLRPQETLLRSVPVQYNVFDLLYHGEESLTGSPYTERRARLEDLGLNSDPVHT